MESVSKAVIGESSKTTKKDPGVEFPCFPIIVQDQDNNYSITLDNLTLYNNTTQFTKILALFVALYVNFNIQFIPKIPCTIQFLEKVICKMPIVESQNALHKKRKSKLTLVAVVNAEAVFYNQEDNKEAPKKGKSKLSI